MLSYREIRDEFIGITRAIDAGDLQAAKDAYESVMSQGASLHDRNHLLGKARVNKLIRFAKFGWA